MTIEPDWKAMYDISNRRAYALEQALRAYMEAARTTVTIGYDRWVELEVLALTAIRGGD